MTDAKVHFFSLRGRDGKVENQGVEAETFEIAQALVEKKHPGAEIVHAMCSNMHLRINKLGDDGESIARSMRWKAEGKL